MKLSYRGLLLIGLPLVFQVMLLIVLSVLLWHVQDETSKEARSKEIVEDFFHMEMSVCGAVQKSMLVHLPAGSFAKRFPDELINDIYAETDALKERLGLRPGQTENVAELAKLQEKEKPVLIMSQSEDHHSLRLSTEQKMQYNEQKMQQTRDLMSLMMHLYDVGANVIAVETKNQKQDPAFQARWLNRVYTCLGIAGGFTLLASLGLSYFSSVSICKPLQAMAENAASLSTRQPLWPAMEGGDELAALDRLLHFVDEEVEAALNKERNLIDFAADLVCSIDKDGIFRSVNPYAEQLLGYEPAELIGTAVVRLLPIEEYDKIDSLLGKKLDQDRRMFEMRLLARDKKEIETSWSTIWSRVEQKFFCVVHDITERKQIERLKQDYIAMISHDLRSPLMSILGSINMVQMKTEGISTQAQSDLSSAERSVDHLIALVNDLLDFEKLEAGQMEFEIKVVALDAIFQECAPLVEALLDNSQVQLDLPNYDFKVRGDKLKLVQLTVNLLSNAIKHSPKEGQVKIATRKEGDFIEVAIHDQGPGVPPEHAERIFQPFEQISERATAAMGTGLGLAICKLIVQGHGGQIGVRPSELLGGSAFWFTIPLTRR